MMLGPVFHAELLTTSRRRRYYAARLVYGLMLLALVGWTYEGKRREFEAAGPSAPSLRFLAETAGAIFATFLATQVVAVLVMTPAMVAGAIADERQRKTLHDLLASELTSLEIVGGKLAARLLQLVVLVLVGLPIMSILSLFGGLDPPLILAAFLGTLTTAFSLAAFSIFVSSVSNRARNAIVTTYIGAFLWLAGPWLLPAMLGASWGRSVQWLQALSESIERLDPFLLTRLTNPTSDLPARLAWMAGLQTALGLVFVALAVWRLRPSFAGSERGRGPATRHTAGLGRWFLGRPAVRDDPMLWKEMHVARTGLVLRVFGLLVGVFTTVFLGDALLDLCRSAFAEVVEYGYGDGTGVVHRARDELCEFVQIAGGIAYVVWGLGVASAAAAAISSEREEDTWLSLLGTSLSGWEILRAKAVGALWRWRWAGLLAIGLWTIGLAAGAIHPIAYILTLAAFTAFTGFALAIGLFFSLEAKSTTRAMVATIGTLFVLNVGYMMCLIPLGARIDALWLAPSTPYVMGVVPARYSWVQLLFGSYPSTPSLRLDVVGSIALACGLSVVGYTVAGLGLAGLTVNGFDRVADRPRRPPGVSAALAEASGNGYAPLIDHAEALADGSIPSRG